MNKFKYKKADLITPELLGWITVIAVLLIVLFFTVGNFKGLKLPW